MRENPYKVLGVKDGASYDEIKRAYREMVKKYHPDKYQNNPLADLADVKMREINEAYDAIMKNAGGAYQYQSESGEAQDYNSSGGGGTRQNRSSGQTGQQSQSGQQGQTGQQSQSGQQGQAGQQNQSGQQGQTGQQYQSGQQGWQGGQQSGFADEIELARQARNNINSGNLAEAQRILDRMKNRNAEWYYLQGLVFLRKGWYDRGYASIQRAVSMEPGNFEYRNAMNGMNNQFQGYRQQYGNRGGAASPDMCQICGTLWCADSCCECMGGDLIGCC